MKAVFSMSLVSALLSLLAILGISAMTIVPRPGAETYRAALMGGASMFFFTWLAVAFWARRRWRAEASDPVSPWLRLVLLGICGIYSLIIIFGILG